MIPLPFWNWTNDSTVSAPTATITCIGSGLHQPSVTSNLGGFLGMLILFIFRGMK